MSTYGRELEMKRKKAVKKVKLGKKTAVKAIKKANGKKKRFDRPWTDADFKILHAAVERNAVKRDPDAVRKLSNKLKRTPGAVRQKMHAHGLHLL